ncbi:Conserved oligomeric Golgi complex subunit 2 [Quaeritorhiza haematococci]|nr:Conserved oligomeric Golgi complex subunit 2 [Quaeritorhiza haematococci]
MATAVVGQGVSAAGTGGTVGGMVTGGSPTSSALGPGPISFERSSFLEQGFTPETFLEERRLIPFDRLKSELQQALRDLKNELVELINRDYTDFINLSTNLVGVDGMIADLSRPLEKIRVDVEGVRTTVQGIIDSLEGKLEKRSLIREKKACLQLFLSLHESVSKLEELLNISSNQDESASIGIDAKLIERVAIEYNQLQFLVTRGVGLPFVSNIDWRILRIRDSLTSSLARALKSSFLAVTTNPANTAEVASLTQYLRTYVLIDKIKEAEEVFKEAVVVPFVQKTITRQALEFNPHAFPNQATPILPLREMYNQVLNFIRNDCFKVVELTNKVFRGTNYDLLIDTIWVEVTAAVTKKIAVIFNPGIPDVFHKNYTTTVDFIMSFEKLCQSRKALMNLRSHPSYIEFMKRWQLQIYFQIRFKEIAAQFEEGLSKPLDFDSEVPTVNNGTVDCIFLPYCFISLLDSIRLCWDDQIYLPGLSHRFWKLTLQLLSRYSSWLKSSLPDIHDTSSPSEREKRDDKRPASPQALRSTLSSSAISASAPALNTIGTNENADELIIRQCLYFHNDIKNIGEQVTKTSEDVVLPKLGKTVDRELLEESLNHSLKAIQTILPDLTTRVTSVLIKKCAEALRIRNIPREYRGTKKEPPTKPSYFVPMILKPVSTFVESSKALVGSSTIREWTLVVVEDVTAKYTSLTIETLTMVKNIEESLKRLKKVKKGGASSFGAGGRDESMSDDDKIRLQMYLDVVQFGKELAALGIDVDTFEGYKELYKAVEEPGKSLVRM